MFSSYIYRIAFRYLISKDSKTIINRINGFAFIMIVASSCVLLIVLSAFEGLKNFGLYYTSSFDPDYKIVPKNGVSFYADQQSLDRIRGLYGAIHVSGVAEKKAVLSNEFNSGAAILKGVGDDYYLNETLDSVSLVGVFSPQKENSIYLGAELASSLEAVLSEDFSLLATVTPQNPEMYFGFSPFRNARFDIEGIYQISKDIESKYVFAPFSSVSKLIGLPDNNYTSVEIFSNNKLNQTQLEELALVLFDNNVSVLNKQDLNPALYKMLNTENLAVYLIFSLISFVAMFNLVGALSIMIVEKRKDLRILKSIGGDKNDINRVFFLLGVLITITGCFIGIGVASIIVLFQNNLSFISVPGTSIPYPISLGFKNVLIVLMTISSLGLLTSFWSTRGVRD